MRKSKLLILILCFAAIVSLMYAGCARQEAEPNLPEKDKLVFGGVRSQSGPLKLFEDIAFGPIYRMWVEEVNARGGIYVAEYGKKLPIELKIYDDTSDLGTMTRLMEKLIVEDQVDFLLPPISTAFLYAAAPIAHEHGFLLMGAEGGSASLNTKLATMPKFFSLLNHAEHQIPVLVDLLVEAGVKRAGIIFIADLHGIEYSQPAVPALQMAGIDVVFVKSVPDGISDLTPIINEAKEKGVDAFLCFVYPGQGFLALTQAAELGYNPDVFLIGPGANFEFFNKNFGALTEGIMSWGAWNDKSTPAAKDFLERFLAAGNDAANIDWWGHLPYYASFQILEQAIEATGTIDHTKLAEYIRNNKFDTVMGEAWFVHGNLHTDAYAGHVGQWINGKYEVIGPKDKRTAEPLFPRPFGRE